MESLEWRAEETCANAWPSPRQIWIGDWVLRLAPGISRRANSMNPLTPAAGRLDEVIGVADALFRRHGQPCLFRVPSLLAPDVDRRLQDLDFSEEGRTVTLYADIGDLDASTEDRIECLSAPDDNWFADMSALQAHDAARSAIYRSIIGLIAVPAVFVRSIQDGKTASLAYAALHNGLVCCESVITAPAFRGQGHARRTMQATFAWASTNGAEGVCLQVEAENAPAVALYRGLGLSRDLYTYHYRRAPN